VPLDAIPTPPALSVEPPALSVERFSRSYETHRAVIDLSFELRSGEILGLVGPNGAGKTTTLRTVAGVLPVKEGRIAVAGHDVAKDEEAAKRCLRWIPDDPQPFDSLTVFEHLEFTAAMYRISSWRERAEQLLSTFELTETRDAFGGELSRGMRQKLAFCCAWLAQPKLVLMDEPLSGLDPRGIRSAKKAIDELARAGSAVILSSHLLVLIEELATRLLILDRGRKVFDGTLSEARAAFPAHERGSLEEIFFAATAPEAGDGGARA
jgi:ABC-2 type transport system ATP-binding protein